MRWDGCLLLLPAVVVTGGTTNRQHVIDRQPLPATITYITRFVESTTMTV
jgi:hypothetical protein